MTSTDLRQREGNFRITNEVSKPRNVFIFIVNSANINSQTANPFLYQTFNVANNRKLRRCYLKANENVYPNIHYKPSTEPSRVYRDVIKYVYGSHFLIDQILSLCSHLFILNYQI